MANSVRTGSTGNRMSSIVSGDKPARGKGSYRASSTVRAESYLNNPDISPVSRLKDYVGPPSKVGLAKPKNIPRTFVPTARPPAKKPVAAKKPAVQVVRNVTNAKFSPTPTQNSTIKKPPATRFGTVTGKTTGTRVSGGGGYGGGGTRGGGSLSGQGSGTRTAGTSRTGGTKQNNPVRG